MALNAALLRAVNVGGRTVAMAELRALASGLGLANPRTLLQTGNLVFESDAAPMELETILEAAILERFGHASDVMVRSAGDWPAILAANPFGEFAKADPAHLVVVFLKSPVGPDAVEKLQAAIVGRETVGGARCEIYITYPDGIGRSKLTAAVAERALGRVLGTARNWNTVLKLAAMVSKSRPGEEGTTNLTKNTNAGHG